MRWRAALFATLGSGLALGFGCERQRAANSVRAELVEALGAFRPTEGRIAGLAYAPFSSRAPTRRPGLAVQDAARRIDRELATRPAPAALSAKALAKITLRDWDAAAVLLRKADEAGAGNPRAAAMAASAGDADGTFPAPARAQINGDLTAVALAKAARDDDPYELLGALRAAKRAVALGGGEQAAFNQALALERLSLNGQAAAAWKHYLTWDAASPWAVEARRHLELLAKVSHAPDWSTQLRSLTAAARRGDMRRAREMVARFRQSSRAHAEEELLKAWAQAAGGGDVDGAGIAIGELAMIGKALAEQTGDGLLDGAARRILESKGEARRLLIAGHLAYAEARRLMREGKLEGADSWLRVAERRLARARSPFALWASFQRSAVAYREKRPEAALTAARDLARRAATRSYLGLGGRANWLVGLIQLEKPDTTAALQVLQQALAQFSDAGEVGNQASIDGLLADAYDYMAMPRVAWKYRYRALQAAVAAHDAERLPPLLADSARTLAKEGWTEAGLAFMDEVLSLDRAAGSDIGVAEDLWVRGLIHHRAGADVQARADLGEARGICRRLADTPPRRHTLGMISAVEGMVARLTDPVTAVHALSLAMAQFRSEDVGFLSVEMLLDRGLAHLALGELSLAETDLSSGIAAYESQRQRLGGSAARMSFFDRAEQVFDTMIRFQVERRGSVETAFDFAERAKARELLEVVAPLPSAGVSAQDRPATAQPLDAAAILAALPASTALIEFHVMADRTLVWVLFRSRITLTSADAGHARISELVRDLGSELRDGRQCEVLRKPSGELYDLLVRPFVERLPPEVALVLVPDQELHAVPFAALFDRRSGRFLAQDRRLATAASASTYLAALSKATAATNDRGPLKLLAVGEPEIDRDRFPDLGPLPVAAREAERVAADYPGSQLLRGKAATVDRFVREIDRYDIVHFAGHAVANPASPWLAKLILAPASSGHRLGDLEAAQIAALSLRRPRLVILSACATGSGALADLEGAAGLARAFLAAGVPAVLASLWPVDDQATGFFFQHFHAVFRSQHDPLLALQEAQIAMLSSSDGKLNAPAAWATFQLFGAANSGAARFRPVKVPVRSAAATRANCPPRSPPP